MGNQPRRASGGEGRRAPSHLKVVASSKPLDMPAAYQPVKELTFSGATAPGGAPWIRVSASFDRQAWIPIADLSEPAAAAKEKMRDANIYIFGDEMAEALKKAREVQRFDPLPLIEAPGWSGPYFALPSGEVFAPANSTDAIVLFERDAHKCATAGKRKTWLKGMKLLAGGQPLVTFALMIGFAGPLLRLSRIQENIGLEISGPKGRGKTTLQYVTSSVAGPAREPQGRNYWISANSTVNALEAQMPHHADMPMVIEEMTMMQAGVGNTARARASLELIFKMASGVGKDRLFTTRQADARFVWLTSTNDPTSKLMTVIGGDAVDAAGDRLLALPVPKGPRGVFVKPLPAGFETGGDVAQAINKLIAANHGKPIRRFLQRLVEARAADEDKLRADVEALIVEFRTAVGVGSNVGSNSRVADAFGLIYAAGVLAQRYRAIPSNLDCLEAARFCHRLNRDSLRPDLANISRVRQLATDKRTVEINTADKGKKYRQRLAAAPALIKDRRNGARELVLTAKMLSAAFGKRKAFLADPEIRKLLRHDGDRTSVKLQLIHDGKMERVICLALPPKRA